jgi:hypothetical protein
MANFLTHTKLALAGGLGIPFVHGVLYWLVLARHWRADFSRKPGLQFPGDFLGFETFNPVTDLKIMEIGKPYAAFGAVLDFLGVVLESL